MDVVRFIRHDERLGRDLYLSIAHDLKTWSPDLSGLPPFVGFCALDTDSEEKETLEAFASHLMGGGCHNIGFWGAGCAYMKFVLDEVWIRENPESVKLPIGAWDENFVMSRWHEDETLDEALWVAVFSAYTAEHDEVTVLAVVSPQYAEQVERRLADTEQLSRDVVGED